MKEHEMLINLAEGDIILVRKNVGDEEIRENILLFHLQQAVEKLVKALLSWQNVIFPRTHDIEELLELCMREGIRLPEYVEEFSELTPYAVEFRYTLVDEEPPNAEHFLRLTESFLQFVRGQTGREES